MIESSFGLPANADAEKTILDAIMLDNACYCEAAEKLDPDDFSLDSHRRIFLRMGELMNSLRTVDIVTLSNELGRTKEIESVGGVAYLASLTEGVPMRQVMRLCSAASTRAADQSEDPDSLIADLDRQLLQIARGVGDEAALSSQVETALQELTDLRERKREPAVSTGLPSLDIIIGGYKGKRLYVFGGRPSMGKTSLMIEAAIQHSVRGIRTRLVSLEMTSEELIHRILA